MGLGGGTCPALGYKVTQARSHVIAPLVRAAPGGSQAGLGLSVPDSSLAAQLAEGAGTYLVRLFLRAKASAARESTRAVLGSQSPSLFPPCELGAKISPGAWHNAGALALAMGKRRVAAQTCPRGCLREAGAGTSLQAKPRGLLNPRGLGPAEDTSARGLRKPVGMRCFPPPWAKRSRQQRASRAGVAGPGGAQRCGASPRVLLHKYPLRAPPGRLPSSWGSKIKFSS